MSRRGPAGSAPRSPASRRPTEPSSSARRWGARGTTSKGAAPAPAAAAPAPGPALPAFRAEERTFQLLTQLAGRSGRDAPGRVLVQTFAPDSRPVALAARHAVEEFLAGELERRRELGYPPFRHLAPILGSGPGGAGAP